MGDQENRWRQVQNLPSHYAGIQNGGRKSLGESTSTESQSRNLESVQMVSEGGKLVPRIMPSVKQIEKTKPRRLNDANFKPSEDSSSSAQSSAEKTGGRKGRSGGVGWKKDNEEWEERQSQFLGAKNDNSHSSGPPKGEAFLEGTQSSERKPYDGLSSIEEEQKIRTDDRMQPNNLNLRNGDGDLKHRQPVGVSKKPSQIESSDEPASQAQPPGNYTDLRKEIENLKAEMDELRAAKRARSSSMDNARLQPLSSQPLNAQGLVSPTFQNNVTNNLRNQRRSLIDARDAEIQPFFNTNHQLIDPNATVGGTKTVQPNKGGSSAGNLPRSKEEITDVMVKEQVKGTKFPFGGTAHRTKKHAIAQGFAKHASDSVQNKRALPESENIEPLTKSEPKKPALSNPQRFDRNKNRPGIWNSNSLTSPRRRKVLPDRRVNGKRKRNASDSISDIAWKKSDKIEKDGCARRALRRMMKARSSSLILLPFHCLLVAFFILYLMVGTLIIVSGSEGRVGAWHWAAVSGEVDSNVPTLLHDPPGRELVRQEVLEKVLDVSMEAALVRSRREILKNIFYSQDMQAAFRAHQETGYQTLPSDSTIRAISDDIIRRWRDDLSAILTRNDFIADLYTLGYQIPSREVEEFLSPYNTLPPGVSWDDPAAMLHAYTLMSTMGGGARTGGSIRGFMVVYAIVGVALYYWMVTVWSRRLSDTLVRLANICSTHTQEEGPQARTSQDHRARALALWFTLLLVLCIWLGACPVGVGTPQASYGERLESATMSLLLVRPPYPLPQSMEAVAVFISCTVAGHFVLLALLAQVSVALERWANRWLGGSPSKEESNPNAS